MDVCSLSQDGEVVRHRQRPARPDAWLKALAPSRAGLVIAVECLFPWSGLAALCAHAGRPFVLGHALSRNALQGGKAKNDKSDAQNSAVRLRGGLLPQAYGYPAQRRAPRALLRRRLPLRRHRAERLAHLQHPKSPSHRPAIGPPLAYQGHRDGVAARFPEPAAPQSVEGDLARRDHEERLRSAVKLPIVRTAQQPKAHALYRRQSVPGLGKMLSWVLRSEIPASTRFPRGQDCVASCRGLQWAKAAAGKRYGTTGAKLGTADLKGAGSEAAVRCLRTHPAGHKYLAR
jgi:hypothetical protein